MTIPLRHRPETTAADAERVQHLLAALGLAPGEPIHTLTIPGVPYSKSRPGFGQRRAYSKPEDVAAEQKTAIYLRATVRRAYTRNVAMACLFYRPTRGVIDTDNLLKHVCDAGNKVLWVDDCQCTGKTGIVELDRENPRTVIALGVHQSTLIRDYSNPKPKIPKGALL